MPNSSFSSRIALTFDDAPTTFEPSVPMDPARMDRIRETLERFEVHDCVAFVVGARAVGEEARLERWLRAGYELGNHTWDHVRASTQDLQAFADSVARCDRLLARIGAFDDNRRRWLRFPYLDRGPDSEGRRHLRERCAALGYSIAHATMEVHDTEYDPLHASATEAHDAVRNRRIEERFLRSAVLGLDLQRCNGAGGEPVPMIAYLHFGPVTAATLGDLLQRWQDKRVTFCSLQEAMAYRGYAAFDSDLTHNGLLRLQRRSLCQRIRRKLVRGCERLQVFGQGRFGPLWPHHRD